MGYWNSEPDGCDFAFDAVTLAVGRIIQQMFKDANVVLEKQYPEQSMIASLRCLRLISISFPKNVNSQFGSKSFAELRNLFESWYSEVKSKIPAKHREAIWTSAQDEFRLFEETCLTKNQS